MNTEVIRVILLLAAIACGVAADQLALAGEPITNRTLLSRDDAPRIALTADEQNWLSAHPVIRVGGSSELEPQFIAQPSGSVVGLVPDMYQLLGKRLGVRFEIVDDAWKSILQRINGPELDMIGLMNRGAAEGLGLLAIDSPINFWTTVFARKDRTFKVGAAEDLRGLRVAYSKDIVFLDRYFTQRKDQLQAIGVGSAFDAMKLVLEKNADVMVGFNHDYWLLLKHTIPEIEPIYTFSEFSPNAVLAVRTDRPLLASALQKAVSSLSPLEMNEIVSRWSWAPEKAERINLTAEERAWIAAHPKITLGADADWRPYVIQNSDGSVSGVEADIIGRINALAGLNLRIELGKWADLVERAKRGEIDGLAMSAYQESRAPYLLFSDSPYSVFKYLFVRQEDLGVIKGMGDLAGEQVAYQRANLFIERLLQRYPEIVPVPVESDKEMLERLLSGEVRAGINGANFSLLLAERVLAEVRLAFVAPNSEIKILYSTRKDWPELNRIINKGLAAIPQTDRLAILQKWSTGAAQLPPVQKLALSPEEEAWLAQEHTVRVRVDYLPPTLVTDPEPAGIAVDYLKAISAKAGFRVEFVPPGAISWSEAVDDLIGERRFYDLLPAMTFSAERSKQIGFSDVYQFRPSVIVTAEEADFVSRLEDLNGKKVAVEKGYVAAERLQMRYPEIDLLIKENTLEALRATALGEADAYVGDLTTAAYLIREHSLGNLKVAAPAEGDNDQVMGVRKDWPELVSLINKSLAAMTPAEHEAIRNRWLSVRYEQTANWRAVSKWGLGLSAIFFLIIGLILLWNRTLQREIDRRRLAERDLRREREQTQRYLDTAQTFLVALDQEGRVRMINRFGCELLGYAEAELLDGDWFSICLPEPEARERIYPLFSRMMAGELELFEYFENLVRRKDGSLLSIAWHNALLRDEEGNISGTLSSGEDITERKLAEDKLKQLNEELMLFKRFAEAATQGVGMATLDRAPFFYNKRLLQMLGLPAESPQSSVPKDFFVYYPKWAQEKIHHEVLPALMLQGHWTGELALINQTTKEETPTLESLLLIKQPDGDPLCIMELMTDVSDLKRIEKELVRAKDQAESANRAKSIFLANMSHELRTPLNAILGFSEMLAHDPAASAGQQQKLEIINRNGEHLLGMINEVLDLSKIEAGAVDLESKPFELPRLLEDLGQMFRLRAEHAGLRFDLELEAGLPRSIEADPGKLRQVLINLLGNAVKFTREGGVVLHVRSEAGVAPCHCLLHIEVADSGPGIPLDRQQSIFEPFVQASREHRVHGTGLGLTITRSFISLMGGTIRVESEEGKGARFFVELPVKHCENGATGTLREMPRVIGLEPGQPAWKVLLVEDNAESRLLLRERLEPIGFAIEEAENGAEAIACFEAWRPHFIWMDMRMPVMDGQEATRRIRALPGGDQVRIVALTAHAFEEERRWMLAAGCDAVLHKPFRINEIYQELAGQLGVRYRYAETSPVVAAEPTAPLTSEMLSPLDDELRKSLIEAAHRLDFDSILELVRPLAETAPDLARGLRELAEGFRFDQILTLLGEPTI